jgi:hypothetical protein
MRFFVCLALALMLCCSSGSPTPGAALLSASPLPRGAAAHFTAHLDRQAKTLVFARVPDAASLSPASVNSINDPALGGTDNPTAMDVDLISPQACTYPPGQFQCGVEMIWGSPTRSVPNPVVQIDKDILDATGMETSLYDANNSDQSNPLGVSIDHGLWVYTNSGEPDMANPVPSGGPFYLTSKAAGFNTGTRMWSFDDPSGQSVGVDYDILVWASLTYSTYSFNFGSTKYVNVCSGGASVTTSTGSLALPFDVTLYDQTYIAGQSLSFAKNGQITFGSVGLTAADEPPTGGLPSASAPEPSFWAFWDDLKFRTTAPKGKLCTETIGVAPNRTLAVEWRDMDFADAPDEGSDLIFETLIHEGTSEIDTVYKTMTAASGDTSGREQGSLAWVGVQNASGTKAVGEYEEEDYGAGSSYAYVPKP